MPPKYKKTATKRSIVVQGFNIQGSNNTLKGIAVTDNIVESSTAEEEIIIQGFNLVENSRNNNFENAIAKDNRVMTNYESDNEKESVGNGNGELEEKKSQLKEGEEPQEVQTPETENK